MKLEVKSSMLFIGQYRTYARNPFAERTLQISPILRGLYDERHSVNPSEEVPYAQSPQKKTCVERRDDGFLRSYPFESSNSSCHAIWIASSRDSLDLAGSSAKPSSSVTYLSRSVKRTVSGSTSGNFSCN